MCCEALRRVIHCSNKLDNIRDKEQCDSEAVSGLASDLHLEQQAGISWLIDPLKGHAGCPPTQWWMGVHVALRKDFCSRSPHAPVPLHGKTDMGGGGMGEKQGVDLFSYKQPLFSLCRLVTHTPQKNERKKNVAQEKKCHERG